MMRRHSTTKEEHGYREVHAFALFPMLQFVCRQGLKKFGAYFQRPTQCPWFAMPLYSGNRHQTGHGFLAARNDNLFTVARLLNQPREVGLGLMNGKSFHYLI